MDAFTPNWHFSETILLVVNPHADAEFELIMTRASTRCYSESRGNQACGAMRFTLALRISSGITPAH
jgi:hypothetical protein